MRDCNNRSRIVVQVLFKPRDSFRIKVIGRLVEQENVGLLQKQTAQSHAAAFTAGKNVNNLLRRRAAERVHRKFKVVIKIPRIKRVKPVLQFRLPRTQFIKIRIGVAERFVYFVELRKQIRNFFYALAHNLAHSLSRFKLRLLLQITDCVPRRKRSLSGIVRVDSRKNLKQTGLSRAVRPDNADFCAVKIRNADVFKNDFGAVCAAHVVHCVNDFLIVECLCHTRII